jgi:hypothetical protein
MKDLLYYGANRQDFVLVRPPGTAGAIFTPTPNNLWYCKVLLLFDMELAFNAYTQSYLHEFD